MPITKEFFESTQRSSEIREVGVRILNRISQLLTLDTSDHSEDVNRINSELELLEGMLISLGIRKDMSAGRTKAEYEKDPVLAIEYVAGQIYNFYLVPIPNESEIRGTTGEFNLIDRPDDRSPYLLELKSAPDQVIDFMRAQTMLGILKEFIDYQPEDELL